MRNTLGQLGSFGGFPVYHVVPAGIFFCCSVFDRMPTMGKVFCVDSKLVKASFRNVAFLLFGCGQGDETGTHITNSERLSVKGSPGRGLRG